MSNRLGERVKGGVVVAVVVLLLLTLQSWNIRSVGYNKRALCVADTVVSPVDSLYQRTIDSLFYLNLSLDSLRRMGLPDYIVNGVDSLYKADSLAHIKIYTPKELKQMRSLPSLFRMNRIDWEDRYLFMH